MPSASLNGSDWTLTGYWQHQWRFAKEGDLGQSRRVPVPTVPAIVPGAVHADLLRAGMIPDWQDGLNAERSEWVNNREWIYRKRVTVPVEWGEGPVEAADAAAVSGSSIALECDGLDYSGLVFVDGTEVGSFEGTHFRHVFDLTNVVQPGQTFELEILFHLSPQIEGVFGYTSKTRVFKPRFGYCWDWCPRVVNVGIWQDVRLVCRGTGQLDGLRVLTSVDDALRAGLVRVQGKVRGAAQSARYRLVDAAGAVVASGERPVDDARLDLAIDVDRVSLWWPATHGAQPMYRLQVELLDAKGAVSDAIERTIGFRRIRWLDNPGAPANAKPYLCEVNGRPLFIRGINWVPLSPFYGTVSAERYEAMLRLYRHMNVNLLRVWGGAILETDAFYEACDRLGMMVWQEFPLSSSGIENWPPEDPKVIDQLQRIAEEYVERRGHHPSHVLWCGGNELQGGLDGGKSGVGKPVDELHPLMVRWQELLAKLDPGKRFQASSPSGPTFYAHAENFGKGIHHQTHGPWGWGDVPFERLHAYWNADDSLFRSENGFPGCSSMAALERHKGDQVLWPPRDANRHWVVPTAAWIPWDDVAAAFGPIADDPGSLPTVVKAHRYLQAESYRCAAEACRRRFPTCSGYIVWMGHDCLHNTANNSVIETDGATKPGYDVLQRAYARRHVSLRHESAYCVPESLFTGSVHLHVDDVSCAGTVITSLMKLSGETVNCLTFDAADKRDMRLNWQVPACAERLFLVDVAWQYADGVAHNRYVISQQREQVLAPLLALPEAKLDVRREAPSCVVVRNSGTVAAIGVRVVCEAPSWAILTDINGVVLLPGEAQSFAYELVSLERGLVDLPHVAVECLNQRELVMV